MKSNPSIEAQSPDYTQADWQTRPSIQDRLTIYNESGNKADRRPICTIIHSERVKPEDLKLMLAAPRLARALRRLWREESIAREYTDQHTAERLNDALIEAENALVAAGLQL